MKKIELSLPTYKDLRDFVKIAVKFGEDYSIDLDLHSDQYRVDVPSLAGIANMDLESIDLLVETGNEDVLKALKTAIGKWIV